MKYIITILIFLFVVQKNVHSQAKSKIWQVIQVEELNDFSLNGKITLHELLYLDEDWEQLRKTMGSPSKEIKRENSSDLGLKPSQIFIYPGIKIQYSDSYADMTNNVIFASAQILSPDASLKYKGVEIRINDDIKILQDLFPEAFEKRHDIRLDDTGDFYIQINVEKRNIGITFRYHPDQNKIKEIEFDQILL